MSAGRKSRRALIVCSQAIIGSFIVLTCAQARAAVNVSVLSPKFGSTPGSPVFYEASATSGCAAGIAAMRIFSARGDCL